MQNLNLLFWQSLGKHSDLNSSTYQAYYVVELLKACVPSPNLTFPALLFTFPFLPITPAPFSHFTYPSGPACSWGGRAGSSIRALFSPSWPQDPKEIFLQRDWSLGRTFPSPHPRNPISLSWRGPGAPNSRVIHEAGVRHLLEIDSNRNLLPGLTPRDPLFNHVLQIGKPSPDVSEVFHRISSGAGIPVSEKEPETGTRDVDGNGQDNSLTLSTRGLGIHSPETLSWTFPHSLILFSRSQFKSQWWILASAWFVMAFIQGLYFELYKLSYFLWFNLILLMYRLSPVSIPYSVTNVISQWLWWNLICRISVKITQYLEIFISKLLEGQPRTSAEVRK